MKEKLKPTKNLIAAFVVAVGLGVSLNSSAGPLFEEMTIDDKTTVLQAISRFCTAIQLAAEEDCLGMVLEDPFDTEDNLLDCLKEAERKGRNCQESFERLVN